MTARELRQKYLEFFQSKGHSIFPSGSLVPYDVTGRLDESLLFNGAGMVQFKPFFRGVAEPPSKRLTTAQKCVRTGDIETVGDLTHLTFFEMMGNFSFGDYFKEGAIAMSWEFLTSPEWLGLDPHRLSFTVFEEDDEAFAHWSKHLSAIGINPETRLFRLGEETNYWPAGAFSSGPPGPCGPNTEMFYWTSETVPVPSIESGYGREDWIRDDEAKNWLEIWNDVFIQYEWKGHLRNPERPNEGYVKDGMPELPFKSVDTGMGLERTITVLTGKKSLYDTDLFDPILRRLGEMGQCSYDSDDNPKSRAIRIIADHIRTACFCIADGILPGNTGRGYVLRRLIRRAVLKGQRTLGFTEPFFHRVYEGVVEAMGDHYHELVDRRDVIVETLFNEETQFRRTVAAGSEMLQTELDKLGRAGSDALKVLSGGLAFRLYDTYGFPLEVTREICEEAGVEVDEEGYEIALKEAQERSRGASGMDTVYGNVEITIQFEKPTPTQFDGYQATEEMSQIVGAIQVPDGENLIAIALDRTPFYAESGGQVADTGTIFGEGFSLKVLDVSKQEGIWVHLCESRSAPDALFGQTVRAVVDAGRRARIVRNHTSTHLLHAALRQVLGKHVTQAGSLVAPDHLRFDFTHGKAMTPEEIAEVERLVNGQTLYGSPVNIHTDVPIAEARALGAMALFGEKYGEFVRVVEIPGFSIELCGGIHVNNTAQCGLFKILHESSAASGVRRIEAISGEGAYEAVVAQTDLIHRAAGLMKTTPNQVVHGIERLIEELREERKKVEKLQARLVGGSTASAASTVMVGPFSVWTSSFEDVDQKVAAQAVDQVVAANAATVAVASVVADGKVVFIAKCGPDAVAQGAHAGNIVREVAKIAGGGGGGRPDFATAGGKDAAKAKEALAAVVGLLG